MINGAAQQRKAKAIPFFSLRMGRMDCFAFSLRACRPLRNLRMEVGLVFSFFGGLWPLAAARGSAKEREQQHQIKESGFIPAELAAIGGFSCLPSLLAARVMGGWPPMAPPREKTSEDKKRSQQQSKKAIHK